MPGAPLAQRDREQDQQPPTMSNPFADPKDDAHGFDSNPFEDNAAVGYGASQSEVHLPPTGKIGTSSTTAGGSDMASRFDDLERRERELQAREAALQNKAEHIRKHGRNNWPPGPFPLIFHSIEEEIPSESQHTVLTLYRVWLFLLVTLILNMVGGIMLFVSGSGDGGSDLGASIMYLPVIGILSFILWYRPVYNAYLKEFAFFYYMYFVFAAFHVAFCAYMFVGIPSTGSAGVINTIGRWTGGHIVAGVFCTLATVAWALEGLGSMFMFRIVRRHSSGDKGHTFSQAKQEIQMYGLKAYLFSSKASTGP